MIGRIPLLIQVGLVAALFVSAAGVLWHTASSAVGREHHRAEVLRVLQEADDELARRGAQGLVLVPVWPETLDPAEWAMLNGWLGEQADDVLRSLGSIEAEGGFYLPDEGRYLGYGASAKQGVEGGSSPGFGGRPSSADPPRREFEIVDAQVQAALDRERPLELLLERPSGTLALRTGPVWVNGRKVAATWSLARIDDPLSLDRASRGYRLAATLGIGGIALALLLSVHLALLARRQTREKERIQAELNRSERLAALGKLLAGVAHEVRNPLAGIRSTAQLWQRGIGPDPESIADVSAEVDRLEAIVAQLLQFSRAESEIRVPTDPNVIVVEAARLARPQADEQDVHVALDLGTGLPAVPCSAPAILQVLRNLTTNALQAMPDGGILRIATRHDEARRQVLIRVSDTGPGLSRDVWDHLFEPFFTTKENGTGLGLAIAREIALAHGGTLSTGPPPDRPGASFTLALPVADAGTSAAARSRAGVRPWNAS